MDATKELQAGIVAEKDRAVAAEAKIKGTVSAILISQPAQQPIGKVENLLTSSRAVIIITLKWFPTRLLLQLILV